MEIKIIQNYILYLIKDCGLSVSLHPFQDETLITGSTLHIGAAIGCLIAVAVMVAVVVAMIINTNKKLRKEYALKA